MNSDQMQKAAGLGRALPWVRWYARDALDGTAALSPMEELAYRRLLDLIFASGDQLRDDDRALAWMTKAGRGWPAIKARLIAIDKISVNGGFIRNARASAECSESARFVAQKSAAGTCSAGVRKSLKNQETRSTAVATAVATGVPTAVATTNTHTKEEEGPASQGAVAPGQGELAGEGWSAGSRDQGPTARLYAEGLPVLATLLGKALPEQRGPVAALLGKLRKEAGDDAALMAVLLDAKAKRPADPVSWLHAAVRARRGSGGPALALDNTAAADPWGIAGWCATVPGVSAPDAEDAGRGRFLLGGALLDVAARVICEAAGLPRAWRGRLDAVAGWLNDGISSGDAAEAIARVAARPGYDPTAVRSLGLFDGAVRERRAA